MPPLNSMMLKNLKGVEMGAHDVPSDTSMSALLAGVRQVLKLNPELEIFLFCGNSLSEVVQCRKDIPHAATVHVVTVPALIARIAEHGFSVDKKMLNAILDSSTFDINAKDHAGKTAVHHACATLQALLKTAPTTATTALTKQVARLTETLTLLRSKRANLFAVDADGRTAVHLLCAVDVPVHHEVAVLAVLRCLVDGAGETPWAQLYDGDGQQPLHVACQHSSRAVVQFLIDNSSDELLMVPSAGSFGFTPLHIVANHGRSDAYDCLVAALRAAGFLDVGLSTADALGRSPLHVAVAAEHLPLVQDLLNVGANPDAQDDDGSTALLVAITANFKEAVKLLVTNGADVDLPEGEPVALAMGGGAVTTETFEWFLDGVAETEFGIAGEPGSHSLLHQAVAADNLAAVRTLLARKVPVDALEDAGDGNSALHYAVLNGNVEMVTVLIDEGGARPDVEDMGDRTPLHRALESRQTDVVLALIDRGAVISDTYGTDAIHIAAETAIDMTVIKALVDRGVSVDARDQLGRTPVHCALATRPPKMATALALLDLGATLFALTNDGSTVLHQLGRVAVGSPHDSHVVKAFETLLTRAQAFPKLCCLHGCCQPAVYAFRALDCRGDSVGFCSYECRFKAKEQQEQGLIAGTLQEWLDAVPQLPAGGGRTALHLRQDFADHRPAFLLIDAGAASEIRPAGSLPKQDLVGRYGNWIRRRGFAMFLRGAGYLEPRPDVTYKPAGVPTAVNVRFVNNFHRDVMLVPSALYHVPENVAPGESTSVRFASFSVYELDPNGPLTLLKQVSTDSITAWLVKEGQVLTVYAVNPSTPAPAPAPAPTPEPLFPIRARGDSSSSSSNSSSSSSSSTGAAPAAASSTIALTDLPAPPAPPPKPHPSTSMLPNFLRSFFDPRPSGPKQPAETGLPSPASGGAPAAAGGSVSATKALPVVTASLSRVQWTVDRVFASRPLHTHIMSFI